MLKKIYNFFIFSNIFISICAMAQVLLSFRFLNIKPDWIIVAFVGLSTLGMYNFSMVLSRPKATVNPSQQKALWSFQHHKLMLIITLVTFTLSSLIFLFHFNEHSKILMSIIGSIALLYNLPLISLKGKKVGLRNIPIIKVLLISLVWSISCTTLPLMAKDYHLFNYPSFLIRSLNSFLFVTAITIPFDIRDMYQDRFYHMKTIPILIGKKKSYLLCYTLLIAHLILLWTCIPFDSAVHYGTSINLVLTSILIHWTRLNKNYLYYFLLLDGTLLSQYLLVEILSLWK